MRPTWRLFLPALGAIALGAAAYVNFLVFAPQELLVTGALVLAVVTAAVAIITYSKLREFAWGWLGGYAVLTLMSGGSCTLFIEGLDPSGGLLVLGFFGYPVLALLFLLITTVRVIVRSIRHQ